MQRSTLPILIFKGNHSVSLEQPAMASISCYVLLLHTYSWHGLDWSMQEQLSITMNCEDGIIEKGRRWTRACIQIIVFEDWSDSFSTSTSVFFNDFSDISSRNLCLFVLEIYKLLKVNKERLQNGRYPLSNNDNGNEERTIYQNRIHSWRCEI